MDLFKKYHTVKPSNFPDNWLTDAVADSISAFQNFLSSGEVHIAELERSKKLLKQKSVQEFLEPIMGKGYYKIVSSMTMADLNSMPNLSSRENKTKFFGLIKNNELKIRVGNKEIIPASLIEFSRITIPREIQLLNASQTIHEDTIHTWSCDACGGNGATYETRKRTVHDGHMPRQSSYESISDYHRASSEWFNSARTEDYEVKHTCSTCDGKGKIGFSFKDFKKYIEKFNDHVEKINKEISDVNYESVQSVRDYNNIIEDINKKIKVWNSKCPENMVDHSHESSKDHVKYFLNLLNCDSASEFKNTYLAEQQANFDFLKISRRFVYGTALDDRSIRIQKLVEAKSAQEFLEPVVNDGYYKIIDSITVDELEALPDLSDDDNKRKFFGLTKSKDKKMNFRGQYVDALFLKEFTPMTLSENADDGIVVLVKEYNNKIEELNAKIRIWNSKCPFHSKDKSHESEGDYIKYWFGYVH